MSDTDSKVELTLSATDKASPVVDEANKKIRDSLKATEAAAAESAEGQVAALDTIKEKAAIVAGTVAGMGDGYAAANAAAAESAASRVAAETDVQEALGRTTAAEGDLAEAVQGSAEAAAAGASDIGSSMGEVTESAGEAAEALRGTGRAGAESAAGVASVGEAAARMGEEVSEAGAQITATSEGAAKSLSSVGEAGAMAGRQVAAGAEGAAAGIRSVSEAAARQAEAMGESGAAASAALAKVEAAAAKLAKVQGPRGLQRAIVQATVAAEELEAEIKRLSSTGVNTSALEARLASLRGEIQAGTDKAGQFAAANREVAESVHAAQRAAGEYEGTLGNLREVISTVSPGLGRMAGNILAIHAGSFIMIAVLKQVIETVNELGEKGAAMLAEHLEAVNRQMEVQSGNAGHLSANLRNILAAQGFDVARDSISQLEKKYEEWQDQQRKMPALIAQVADGIVGNSVKMKESVATTMGGVSEAMERASQKGATDADSIAKAFGTSFGKTKTDAEAAAATVTSAVGQISASTVVRLTETQKTVEGVVEKFALLSPIFGSVMSGLFRGMTGVQEVTKETAKESLPVLQEISSELHEALETGSDYSAVAARGVAELNEEIARLRSEGNSAWSSLGNVVIALQKLAEDATAKEAGKNFGTTAKELAEFSGRLNSVVAGLGTTASPVLVKVSNDLANAVARGGDVAEAAQHGLTAVTDEINRLQAGGQRVDDSLFAVQDAFHRLADDQSARTVNERFSSLVDSIKALGVNVPPVLAKVASDFSQAAAAGGNYHQVAESEIAGLKSYIANIDSQMATATPVMQVALERFKRATEETLGAIEALASETKLSAPEAAAALKAVVAQIEDLESKSQPVPKDLLKMRDELTALARTAADTASEHDALLASLGVKTPAEVAKGVKALFDYRSEVETSGHVTAEQSQFMVQKIGELRRELALLPEDQRASMAGYIKSLDELEGKLRETGDVAREAFGIKTPDAIHHTVESLHGLIASFGSIGSISKEGAEKVSEAAREILKDYGMLSPGEQAAAAGTIAWAKSVESSYGAASLSAQSFATNTVEQLKKVEGELKSVLSSIASVGAGLVEEANREAEKNQTDRAAKSAAQIGELKKQVQGYETKTGKSEADYAALDKLKQQLNEAETAADSLHDALGHESPIGKDETALSADRVSAGVQKIVESLRQNKDGWNSLDATSKEAIENQVESLKRDGDAGTATATQVTNAVQAIADIFTRAGVDSSVITDKLHDAAAAGQDLGNQFADLNKPLSVAVNLMGGVAQAGGSAAVNAAKVGENAAAAGKAIDDGFQAGVASVRALIGPLQTVDALIRSIALTAGGIRLGGGAPSLPPPVSPSGGDSAGQGETP